ncbi:MAG: asparagine synthase-related protein, partial [Nitriliruptoraceae bacterium]
RMQTVDLDAWLPGDILAKADRASMAHSLEVRVPFLDDEVWSVARRIPARLRLAKGTTKYILRRSVADLLPEQVTNRRKLGFPVPVTGWLRGPHGADVAPRLLEGPLGSMFDPRVVQRVVADHRDGRAEHGRLVWTLLVLAVWAEEMTAHDRPGAVVSG